MLTDIAKSRKPRSEATFGKLLEAVLEVANLNFNTLVTCQRYIEQTVRHALGAYGVGHAELSPGAADCEGPVGTSRT